MTTMKKRSKKTQARKSKLKIDDLENAESLGEDEKQALLGGTKSELNLNLSGSNIVDGERFDVRRDKLRKRTNRWKVTIDNVRKKP